MSTVEQTSAAAAGIGRPLKRLLSIVVIWTLNPARSEAEGDEVGKGVVFAPELAARPREPRYPAVQAVEYAGDDYGYGRVLVIAVQRGNDGVETAKEARRSYEVRQEVDPLLDLFLFRTFDVYLVVKHPSTPVLKSPPSPCPRPLRWPHILRADIRRPLS